MPRTRRAISDIHLSPGDEYPSVDLHGPLVLVGDVFNILPWGIKAWRTLKGIRTVNSLLDCLDDDAVFISGNHDPYGWLQELVPDYRVERRYQVDGWTFMHGHQFAPDWHYLSFVAPQFQEFMLSHVWTAKLWYWYCKRQGWMATGTTESNKKYEEMVSMVWGMANKYAHDHGNLCIGHTHSRMTFQDDFVKIVDCGANELVIL